MQSFGAGQYNPGRAGNARVHTQHFRCSYWCPVVNAQGHQHQQCWLNLHCIWPVSNRNITFWENNFRKRNSIFLNYPVLRDNPVTASIWSLHSSLPEPRSWWRHQMETCSASLAICAGNSPVTGEFAHKGQWRGAFTFSLICTWINGWVNNREAGDLRRHRAHYDVTVLWWSI